MGSYIHDDEPPGVLEEVGELVALVMAHRGIEVLGQTFFLVVLLGAVVEVRASVGHERLEYREHAVVMDVNVQH